MSMSSRHPHAQGIENQLAARLAAMLSESAQDLPHDIGERLRVARERAVARAREVRQSARVANTPPVVLGVTAHGAALMGRPAAWWQRLASALPVIVLVAGLVMIDRHAQLEQVRAAAEIDAQLLADDLPPAAYSDPGFAEYLRTPPP